MVRRTILLMAIALSMAILASCNTFRKSISERVEQQHYSAALVTADSARWTRNWMQQRDIKVTLLHTPLAPDGSIDTTGLFFRDTWTISEISTAKDTLDRRGCAETALESILADSVYNCSTDVEKVEHTRNFSNGIKFGILLSILAALAVYRCARR